MGLGVRPFGAAGIFLDSVARRSQPEFGWNGAKSAPVRRKNCLAVLRCAIARTGIEKEHRMRVWKIFEMKSFASWS
jgi:hypothetical protein